MKSIPIFGTEQRIPQKVGALQFQRLIQFDDERLGVQIRYSAPDGTKADVYLYNLGLSSIPEDLTSAAAQELFQSACDEVLGLADEKFYLDLQLLSSQHLHLPDNSPVPTYLWAAFYYQQAPGPLTQLEGKRYSHLALRTDRGFINKVRYTYPEDLAETAASGLVSFLFAWHNFVKHG